MPTPATQPDTPNPVGGNALKTGFGSLTHTQGLQKMVTDIANIWAKVGNGAANQVASAAGMVGRVLLAKLDGTTEWLYLYLFNSLLNGGMEFWPRGTSIAVPASTTTVAAGLGPARWVLTTGANQACHIDQVAGLTDTSQWAARIRRDSGQTGTGTLVFEQAFTLAEVIKHRNDYYCVAPVVKSGTNWSPSTGNLTIRVACGTAAAARRKGSAYTGEVTLINQTVAVTAGGSAQTLGPWISTVVVPPTATQMSVCFEWTPVGTAGAADDISIDDTMGNKGSVPMAYKARPDDELQCLRYYRELGSATGESFAVLQAFAVNQAAGTLPIQPPMIGTPSVAFSAASDFQLTQANSTATACSSIPVGTVTANSVRLEPVPGSSVLVAGNATELIAANGNARIKINAEVS